MVTQESFLFNGTIRENLQIGKPGASDEELLKRQKRRMPGVLSISCENGLGSVVGERGVKLSVGEKQTALDCARALERSADFDSGRSDRQRGHHDRAVDSGGAEN